MSAASVQLQIDELVAQRKDAWSRGEGTGELDDRLQKLYEQLRAARAREDHGERASIVRLARIDRELEKLSER